MVFFNQTIAKDRVQLKVGKIITNFTKAIFHNYATQLMHIAVIAIDIAQLEISRVSTVSLTGNYANLFTEDMIAIQLPDNGAQLLMVLI